MTRLQELYEIGGQSPWLDNLRRDWLQDGQLADLLELGIRGITSNPTIFANAISGQDTYDDQFRALMKDHTVDAAYWEMAITDIENALALLRPALRRERPARTATSRWRSPRRWPTTPTGRSRRPATCTRASPSPTSSSRCPPRRRVSRPFRP